MADLKIGETYEDRIYITETATGAAKTGLSPTCTIIDESGNRSAGTVAEMANGWYKVTDFTPDAAGTWCTEWRLANVGYSVHYPFKMFKVEGGLAQDLLAFQHQAEITFSQAAPVQNQWYTVLNTTANVKLLQMLLSVAATGETLAVKFTMDGQVYTATVAAVAGTTYFVHGTTTNWVNFDTTARGIFAVYGSWEARSAKIEVRKTTAAGNGTITAYLSYAKR